METLLIRLLGCFFGTLGFSMIYNLKPKYYLYVMFSGMLVYADFYFIYEQTEKLFLANLLATILLEVIVQLYSKILKTPRIILFVPIVLVLIPGGTLFNMMKGIVLGTEYIAYLRYVVMCMLGISAGSASITAIIVFIKKIRNQIRSK